MVSYNPFLGLLVPKFNASLIDSNTGQRLSEKSGHAPSVAYTDIKKGKDGKMIMVRHKTKGGSVTGGGGEVTTEDVKKDEKRDDKKPDKYGDKKEEKASEKGADQKKDEKKEDGEKKWTSEEDAKLKQMKADGKTWAQITEELGRPKHELQTRFKEINRDGAAAGSGADQKTDEKKETKDGDKKNGEKKDGEAGDNAGVSNGDFTAEDDQKIKEMLATNTGFKKIAATLDRKLDSALRDHLQKLKIEVDSAAKDGADKNKDAGNDKKNDKTDNKKGSDKGDKKEEKPKEQPPKEDQKEAGKEQKAKDEQKSPFHHKNDKPASKQNHHHRKTAPQAASTRSRRSEAKFTMNEWITLQEDSLFSFKELQLLSEIIMKDTNMSWLRVASAFLDKTGRRVHPDDIADKFHELAAMGH